MVGDKMKGSNAMRAKNIIDLTDLSLEELTAVIDQALEIKKNPAAYADRCKGKILATLFYEPTRTRNSFQTAMLRLGGQVIGFDNPMSTSVSKGETLKDTTIIMSGYADIIAMRHPMEGAAKAAALYASCPVINAGDGGHLHPTQTLTDLVTLKDQKGTLEGLTIGLCGDLKNGRTVHSLCNSMAKFGLKAHFVFISTKELTMPEYITEILDHSPCTYSFCDSLEEAIPSLDVLYMTRIQKERFDSLEEYERLKNVYVLDPEKMKKAKADLIVLHPLPRVDEITNEVDDDPRALYFYQAKCGVYARMSLILHLLEETPAQGITFGGEDASFRCPNPKCITKSEGYLPHACHKDGEHTCCEYCDARI